MKDVRFYLEFPDAKTKRKSGKANTGHEGNVFAMFINPDTGNPYYSPDGSMSGLGAVFFFPDSPVATTASSREYLRTRTKRIPEALARKIHPELFVRLDDVDENGDGEFTDGDVMNMSED